MGELSTEEKELLITAAAGVGVFQNISDVDKVPRPGIIVKYSRNLFNTKNRATVVKYFEAFNSLLRRGFICEAAGKSYMLTGSGWDKARSLRENLTVPNNR
jgi:hypothetical protein